MVKRYTGIVEIVGDTLQKCLEQYFPHRSNCLAEFGLAGEWRSMWRFVFTAIVHSGTSKKKVNETLGAFTTSRFLQKERKSYWLRTNRYCTVINERRSRHLRH